MATILESLTQVLSSSTAADVGKAVGLEPNLVTKGMGVVGPLLTSALANRASTPSGLSDVMKLLPADAGSSILGNLGGLLKGGAGAAVLSSIFGAGTSAIGGTLNRALGFNASSLLSFAGPLVLGLIAKRAKDSKLDANGVSNLLTTEAAEFQKTGGENARVVREALDAGRQAVQIQGKFSPQQWETVRLAPMAAATVVMLADKSGVVGAAKEISAAADVIADAKKTASPTSVVSLAFDHDFSVDDLSKFVKGRTRADAIAAVRDAIDAVERNSPADVPVFRQLVSDVATHVASASKEGGFLGIGGTLVSPAEQAAIDELRTAIGDR
jgi:Bacterial protein of unknown function (DUF937)